MDILTKEAFLAWAKKHDWLYVGEIAAPEGRRVTYVTPDGNFVYASYGIDGKLLQLAMPIIPPPQNLQRSVLDPRGGSPGPL